LKFSYVHFHWKTSYYKKNTKQTAIATSLKKKQGSSKPLQLQWIHGPNDSLTTHDLIYSGTSE